MTKAELIEAMSEIPDDAEIVVWHDVEMDPESSDSAMSVTDVRASDAGQTPAVHITVCI